MEINEDLNWKLDVNLHKQIEEWIDEEEIEKELNEMSNDEPDESYSNRFQKRRICFSHRPHPSGLYRYPIATMQRLGQAPGILNDSQAGYMPLRHQFRTSGCKLHRLYTVTLISFVF
jgi:hypothetical protein